MSVYRGGLILLVEETGVPWENHCFLLDKTDEINKTIISITKCIFY